MDVQGLNKNKANELIAEIVNIYKIDGFNRSKKSKKNYLSFFFLFQPTTTF